MLSQDGADLFSFLYAFQVCSVGAIFKFILCSSTSMNWAAVNGKIWSVRVIWFLSAFGRISIMNPYFMVSVGFLILSSFVVGDRVSRLLSFILMVVLKNSFHSDGCMRKYILLSNKFSLYIDRLWEVLHILQAPIGIRSAKILVRKKL